MKYPQRRKWIDHICAADLTTKDIADIYGGSLTWALRLVREGELKATQTTPHGHHHITLVDLEEYCGGDRYIMRKARRTLREKHDRHIHALSRDLVEYMQLNNIDHLCINSDGIFEYEYEY